MSRHGDFEVEVLKVQRWSICRAVLDFWRSGLIIEFLKWRLLEMGNDLLPRALEGFAIQEIVL